MAIAHSPTSFISLHKKDNVITLRSLSGPRGLWVVLQTTVLKRPINQGVGSPKKQHVPLSLARNAFMTGRTFFSGRTFPTLQALSTSSNLCPRDVDCVSWKLNHFALSCRQSVRVGDVDDDEYGQVIFCCFSSNSLFIIQPELWGFCCPHESRLPFKIFTPPQGGGLWRQWVPLFQLGLPSA